MHQEDHHFNACRSRFSFFRRLFSGALCLLIGVSVSSAQMPTLDGGRDGALNGISQAQPLWRTLSDMSAAERHNAHIEFEALESGESSLQLQLNNAAAWWNRGATADAVGVVRSLEESFRAFAFGVSWKSPKLTAKVNGAALSAHGNSFNPHLDAHNGTANLLIAMQDVDSSYHWRVYFSTDGGMNWAET